MLDKDKRGLDKAYRHILSLVLSMVILTIDAVTLENSIETFYDLVLIIWAFIIAGFMYYGLVRITVELLNFVGRGLRLKKDEG